MQNRLTKTEHNKKNYEKHKPYPLRLGALKGFVLRDAVDTDRSGHYILIKIIKDHYKLRFPESPVFADKRGN